MERMRVLFFYCAIFISGASVLIVEIGGTRILTPFYGSTIFVWSSLISVTMIALAFGYMAGGFMADKRPTLHVLWFILFVAGVAIYLIPEYDHLILPPSDQLGSRWGPFVASLVLFAPSLFLLATVSPYAVKLRVKNLKQLGATAGNLYALATFGSLVGALLTGFYLAPNLPITLIFHYTGLTLAALFVLWRILNFIIKKR